MSGVFGFYRISGKPVVMDDLEKMAAPLKRRGPEGTGYWHSGPTGFGHTLLATTPEQVHERLPMVHDASGCVITADVRLDNRDELLAALCIPETDPGIIGDARIILESYLAWGEDCVQRFLGDFAFAVWNPVRQRLFCGRDHLGMRPMYYHYSPARLMVFASEPRAILMLPQVSYRINEGRIADFLVSQLEGIDKTSTFFEDVFRLSPAHTLTVTPQGMELRRYWTLEPGPELYLSSDEAYAEAFLDVFTESVRCRLRGCGPVGSMLSGGMDSGSVVAVARTILADAGKGPLPTFSAVGPDPGTCVETRTIHAAIAMDGLDPHMVNYGQLDDLMPELEALTWNLDEPFDNHMTLLRAIYLAAHRRGIKVMLDGAAGDTVFSEGSYISRLLRAGHWQIACREAIKQNHFWGGHYPAWHTLYMGARTAFTPEPLKHLYRRLFSKNRQRCVQKNIRSSLIDTDFARRVGLGDRLQSMNGNRPSGPLSYRRERAYAILHPYLTVGRERYDRVASAVAVEPRDPYMDLRVVNFCLQLPGSQKLNDGWPKIILRRAMNGRLPDPVRWRRGKEHLGWAFTTALMALTKNRIRNIMDTNWPIMSSYINREAVRKAYHAYFDKEDTVESEKIYEAAHLGVWLNRNVCRPTPQN